jgi:hypothetical protein
MKARKEGSSKPKGMSGGSMLGMKLNPRWVEQLMSVPVGWTQLAGEEHRIDELRLLGNGVVLQTAEKAFRNLHYKLHYDEMLRTNDPFQ